jgi:hypothetical protein
MFQVLHAIVLGTLLMASHNSPWLVVVGSDRELEAWKPPHGDWDIGGDAILDNDNPRKLVAKPGKGVIVQTGKAKNLLSKDSFGDIELHLEFMVPKGSNSGVKFHGHYEIQIHDSWGVNNPTASHCGGVYPRAEAKPKYHHIDKGIPPLVNACKKPGEWQTLDVIFLAPRFDAKGGKIANARLVKVLLNGTLIHDNVELKTPTGDRWKNNEFATGPLYLQADHGGVAFRELRIRPYTTDNKK